jgi:hypothetical protein
MAQRRTRGGEEQVSGPLTFEPWFARPPQSALKKNPLRAEEELV